MTKWNVLDAIRSIAVSWEQITPQAIAVCFRHSGFHHNYCDVTNEDEVDVEDELPEPNAWNQLIDNNITVDCQFHGKFQFRGRTRKPHGQQHCALEALDALNYFRRASNASIADLAAF
ncbi:hypothetical protein PR048_032577 [Dryococelus australis]|uniref:Uncharacterized protein n=1 Tax=Dryococelus australis TaxID=614101 RepID=A0ABQ9G6S4_9NEOP|nr:hypothetical protein PR048_032577 [Dryococelus australis]